MINKWCSEEYPNVVIQIIMLMYGPYKKKFLFQSNIQLYAKYNFRTNIIP